MTGKIVPLWPIFDKYTREFDHLDFIHMQVNTLLEETEVNHLVSDTDRPTHDNSTGEGIIDAK